mmetsp:Transcript_17753/g.37000  ORF Transcript_17753/g.37000 Transcript_17753/m.37000 type:complete len:125 (-) Transcript_17753:176-550(-)
MNSFVTIFVSLMALVQFSSGLIFSPILHRANSWGVGGRSNTAPSIPSPQSVPQKSSSNTVDFGHDEDLLRYKHELLGYVYEKSLSRGFDNDELSSSSFAHSSFDESIHAHNHDSARMTRQHKTS